MTLRHFHDRLHVAALAKEVYRHNGFGARSDGRFYDFGSHIEGVRVHVHHHRAKAQQCNDLSRSHIGESGHDDFVAGFEVQSHEGYLEGVGAVGAGDDVPGAEVGFQILLKAGHGRASYKGGVVHHFADAGVHVFFDFLVLALQIHHLDGALKFGLHILTS